MLWLCIYLPQLSLESLNASRSKPNDSSELGELDDSGDPIAVVVREKNKRRIISSNLAAVRPRTELTIALTLHPALRPLDRNPKAELSALKRLAAWAYQWSSYVTWREAQPHLGDYASLLWLEIGASRALFGGYAALIKQLEDSLRCLDYSYRIGVAPTLEGAALLARANRRVVVTSEKRLVHLVRKLSIRHLALSREILSALNHTGIVAIGALLDIPAAAIARRFGPQTTLYLAQLCGEASDPRSPYRMPNRYRERWEFGFAVHTMEALLFPLQRMLHEFAGYLRAFDIATQRYVFIFEHERGAVTRIEMGLGAPTRDAKRLFSTAREKLHATTWSGSVYALRIEADEFTGPAVRQQGLFANDAEIADELQATLEKISARLGDDAIKIVQTVADHRPEHASQFANEIAAKSATPTCARPLYFLTEPRRLHTQPVIDGQPERIEAGWWDSSLKRDYYTVRSKNGEACWIYLNLHDRQWYLHGFWS